jgi:hypothetical protein
VLSFLVIATELVIQPPLFSSRMAGQVEDRLSMRIEESKAHCVEVVTTLTLELRVVVGLKCCLGVDVAFAGNNTVGTP